MKYNVAVIGGGPAGMMAAGRSGELGARVVLIEKNKRPGGKILITGKGRCNITNNIDNPKLLIEKYGKNGKFLFSAFHRFGTKEIISFLESRGLETKVERGERVFPVSDKALDVLGIFNDYLKTSKVDIKTGNEVKKIVENNNKIEKLVLTSNEEIIADNYVICTGGKSYPTTGATGDGYVWAESLGHTITKLSPALTPIIIKDKFVKDLEGLSLKNIAVNLYKDDKKINSRFGEALFTANGLSGPIILDMSKEIGKELPGNLHLEIDFKPALDFEMLDKRIRRDFSEGNNKLFRNNLSKLLPQKLIPVIIKLSGINPEKKVNTVTKEERKKLVHLLKEFKLSIKELGGYSKAIVTSGGVQLSEVDPKTMKSKLIDNLYFAGEILDLDGPTGGYNLQVCWSTGYVAGESAV